MEDGVFPSYMTIMSDSPEDVEEERRLAYVGITRAKDDLTLTCARQRMIRGETQYNPVSRFVKEIPPLLLDHKLPEPKYKNFEIYDDDFSGRNSFKAKPYEARPYEARSGGAIQTDTAQLSETGYRRTDSVYKRQFGKDADTVFDKPKASARPKAVLKPKRTAYEDQPYITRAAAQIKEKSQDAASSSGSSLGYGQGDRVRHLKYGEGTVMKIEAGPRDYQVTVVFDEVGQKIMYAGFAKLKKV